ncbi:IS21-like element helper ATPase IstB [Vallitalea guaymasensis]|uniref:IS21-like element helper ATPase IstB n=1 Tax=Vallitalea guaymasensis TaxID=1185412 RepID=UPI000DE4AC29|nr:IS21-like element helper ATPase IstB [Vallitalea guaymasensis]
MTMINEVLDKLAYLKLKSAYAYLKELHINDNITPSELKGLNKVLNKEVEAKEENNKLYNVKVAAFPFVKTINEYDFSFQPSINEEKMRNLADSNFYEDGTNIIFIGNPEVGKTHLAISIGYAVAIKRNSVYFIKFSKLINNLRKAYNEGTLEKKLKLYYKYKLLIIDEVGFNEISSLESKLFFQLVDLRYEKRSTIITSNITFEKWPQILGNDEMITKAILDRLLHFSYLFNITGPSYRIKDKLKYNIKKTEEV